MLTNTSLRLPCGLVGVGVILLFNDKTQNRLVGEERMVDDHSINVTTLRFTYPLFSVEVKNERYINGGVYAIL